MAKSSMQSAWNSKRKEDERLQKVKAKKNTDKAELNSKAADTGNESTEPESK